MSSTTPIPANVTMPAMGQGTAPTAGGGATADTAAPVIVHPYTTVSAKTHVLVTLVMKNPDYTKWASFFKSMCGNFCLKPHIDGTSTTPPTTDPLWPSWDQADCCVRSWIFGFIDDVILDLTMDGHEQTTLELWTAMEGCSTPTRSRAPSSCITSSTP
jgi:hypothetical protein